MSKFGAAQGSDFPADPTATDDCLRGFHIGFEWRNTISGAIFRCNANSPGAAVWQNITTGVDTSLLDLITSLEARVTALEGGGGGGGQTGQPLGLLLALTHSS